MELNIGYDDAMKLLKKYNKDEFHIRHAVTVARIMENLSEKYGYGSEREYWKTVGLLHDIDFELYPDQHCIKCVDILRDEGVSEDIIHSVCSHGYGITVDVYPEHEMEKVLYAVDELSGLIYAAALMRPSRSTKDMKVKSLKKKFKSKGFARGCDRGIIQKGAELMGIELGELFQITLDAMRECEDDINNELSEVL